MSDFKLDQGFEAALLRSPEAVAFAHELAKGAEEEVRTIAAPISDRYVKDLSSDAGIEGGRAVGRVIADFFASLFIEFGTRNNPAWAPLRRGFEKIVGHMTDGR